MVVVYMHTSWDGKHKRYKFVATITLYTLKKKLRRDWITRGRAHLDVLEKTRPWRFFIL